MKFHLDNNIVEGTPEELVKYQELLEEKEKEEDLLRFGHEHQSSEQEALINFKGWLGSMKVKDSYTTDSTESSTDEADKPMGYTFWYLEGTTHNESVVLKATYDYFVDSEGLRYTHKAVNSFAKPICRDDVRKQWWSAKDKKALLKYLPIVDEFIQD